MQKKDQVFIQPGKKVYEFELTAARIIANFWQTTVTILREDITKTPDFLVDGRLWELKSPTGNGKYTIHNTFRSSKGQSDRLIIDLRRCKMNDSKALSHIKNHLSKYKDRTHVREVAVIKKGSKIIILSK